MKLQRHGVVLAIVAAGAVLLSACGGSPTTGGSGSSSSANSPAVDCTGKASLTGEGSSAQKNAVDVFAQAYQQKCSGAKIAYNPTGSGAGVKQFNAGLVDFGGSDSALKAGDEANAAAARCQTNPAWNLPLVFGPVAFGYKLDGVSDLTLTPAVAAKIFNGGIKTWNDPAIAEINKGVTLPAIPINVIFRSDESGTTDNFQKYLGAAAKDVWTQGAGKKFNGGIGSGAQGSAGVAQAIASTNGAIGYVELSFAQDNKLGMAKIDSGAGAVALTSENVGKAISGVTITGTGNDLVLDLTKTYAAPPAGAYPLFLATYEIVCSKGYTPDVAKAVKAFLTVAATDGQANLSAAGYAPLPDSFQQKLLTAIQAIA